MKPKTFIIGVIILALAGYAIHIGWNSRHGGVAHERACTYLKERVATAESRMQAGKAELYSEEDVQTIERMFADIKGESDCHQQYLKFHDHLKQHPMKGGRP